MIRDRCCDGGMKGAIHRSLLITGVLGTVLFGTFGSCTRRSIKPVRDPNAYVAEVFWIETSAKIGRRHPEIDQVLRKRSTKILHRFPSFKLIPGQASETEFSQNSHLKRLTLTLNGVQENLVTLHFDMSDQPPVDLATSVVSPPAIGSAELPLVVVPLDTWAAMGAEVDVDVQRGVLRLFVLRVNRPGHD